MKRFLFYPIFIAFSFSGLAQNKPVIPFIDKAITLDGILNEPVWQQLPVISDFNNFFPDDVGKAKNQTNVKLYHNGVNLYIAAVYVDDTTKTFISSLKRDDYVGAVLNSDNFQIIIDTYDKKTNGYFFSVNTKNTKLDGLISFDGTGYDMNASWSTVWHSKTKMEGNKKVFEIAIPLKSLNFNSDDTAWALNFILRDRKSNNWMSWTDMPSNYIQYDLRNTKSFVVEKLQHVNASKFIVTPSITYNYLNDVENKTSKSSFIPSLDAQFRINSSLKLDATLNPDFSQIDVDRQVTNLTRFAVNFPEQRNFFLENADLFSNLGTDEINPFYSRRVGGKGDIQLGLKLSGNITPQSRIGVLDVQTEKSEDFNAQNYGALVFQQQLSKAFMATGFLVNRQETDTEKSENEFNRVTGVNLNYKSSNNKWMGLLNLGKSFSKSIDDKNNFYNFGVDYTTRKTQGNFGFSKVEKNYLMDVGFAPRLYNYDALNNVTIREGFSSTTAELKLFSYPEDSKHIQTIRYFFPSNKTYFDENGKVSQSLSFINAAIWFKSSTSIYINVNHQYDNLKYAFDPLGDGNYIKPDTYSYGSVRIGFNSAGGKKLSISTGLQHGKYYSGKRTRFYLNSKFRLLPFARIGLDYEINHLDLKALGSKAFHLARFKGEVFFNNQLNWTTYVQYNNQFDNFNINSRVQWEYKPLSYVYLVVTDNFNQDIKQTNWGVAIKVNYRFDF